MSKDPPDNGRPPPKAASGSMFGQVFASVKAAPAPNAGASVVACPSCGAPRQVAAQTRCAWCDQPLFPKAP